MKSSIRNIVIIMILFVFVIGAKSSLKFAPPKISDAPTKMRAEVQRGFNIINQTSRYVSDYSGNKMSCSDCHGNAGMEKDSLSLVGVSAVYPKYNQIADKVVDLTTMTNMCLQANLNAKPLPSDSNDMIAILAYFQWISKDIPVYAEVDWLGLEPLTSKNEPDIQNGKKEYSLCTRCHGENGQGSSRNGAHPLWGDNSFTDGSSMAKQDILAGFIKKFMPKGNTGLNTQRASDIAAFILSNPRPEMKK